MSIIAVPCWELWSFALLYAQMIFHSVILLPWFFSSPGHQQSWYWLCWIKARSICFVHVTLSHYHHYSDHYLGALNMWNACLAHPVSCMSSILSIILDAIYGVMCYHLTKFSCDDFENVWTLLYHYQIVNMTCEPLLRARPWNSGMHCTSDYVLHAQLIFRMLTILYKYNKY